MARAGRLVVVALLVLVVVLLAFALTPEGRGVLSSPSAFVKDSVSLGQRIVHWPVQKVEELVARLREAGNLYEENRALRAALDRSLDLAAENERLRRENAELREALGLLPSPRDVRLIPAEVVGRNFEAWYRTVTINRGSRDGVGVGMAVRTPGASWASWSPWPRTPQKYASSRIRSRGAACPCGSRAILRCTGFSTGTTPTTAPIASPWFPSGRSSGRGRQP